MHYLKQITSIEIQQHLLVSNTKEELEILSGLLELIDCYEGGNDKVITKWMDQTGIVDTPQQFVNSYKLLLTLLKRSKVIDPDFFNWVTSVNNILNK